MDTCSLCGIDTEPRWAVPTYNGEVVSVDFPDDLYHSGGGSLAVCERCFLAHERGEVACADAWYVLSKRFTQGEGI